MQLWGFLVRSKKVVQQNAFEKDLQKLQNMTKNGYSVTTADISYVATLPSGADKHVGGVLHPSGKIYYTSYGRPHESLDVESGIFTQFASATGSYFSGAVDKNGDIYSFGTTLPHMIRLNVESKTTTSFTLNKGGYGTVVIGEDENIYGIPASSGQVAMFNVETQTISYFGTIPTTSYGWAGASYGKDKKLYVFPRDGSGILQIDIPKKTITVLTSTIGKEYAGSVTAPDGNVYATPLGSGGIGKLDVTTGIMSKFGSLATGSQYHGGAVGANGKIYFAPRDSQSILEFNPETNTIVTLALGTSTTNKYQGAVLHPNGKIYFTPCFALQVLVLNTGTLLTPEVANTRFFNKY